MLCFCGFELYSRWVPLLLVRRLLQLLQSYWLQCFTKTFSEIVTQDILLHLNAKAIILYSTIVKNILQFLTLTLLHSLWLHFRVWLVQILQRKPLMSFFWMMTSTALLMPSSGEGIFTTLSLNSCSFSSQFAGLLLLLWLLVLAFWG